MSRWSLSIANRQTPLPWAEGRPAVPPLGDSRGLQALGNHTAGSEASSRAAGPSHQSSQGSTLLSLNPQSTGGTHISTHCRPRARAAPLPRGWPVRSGHLTHRKALGANRQCK